jgi:hypothetical protein
MGMVWADLMLDGQVMVIKKDLCYYFLNLNESQLVVLSDEDRW